MDQEPIVCKNDNTRMEVMPVAYATRIRPTRTLQCPTCLRRLFVIDAEPRPLRLWSDDPPFAWYDFSSHAEARAREKQVTIKPQQWPARVARKFASA